MSGPSGVGKSTMIQHLTELHPNKFAFSVSYTTRAPRAGETDGVHYNFVSKEVFLKMVDEDQFIEWAQVHSNMYGTAKAQIKKIQSDKKIPLLDIDVQGSLKFQKAFPNSNFFAILPPGTSTLRKRLESRGDTKKETIDLRINNAAGEMIIQFREKHIFNYRIINDDIEVAKKTLSTLVSALYSKELTGK